LSKVGWAVRRGAVIVCVSVKTFLRIDGAQGAGAFVINALFSVEASKVHNWCRLPLKSLALLGITTGAVLLGMAVPVLMGIAKSWFPSSPDHLLGVYGLGRSLLPSLFVFFGLSLFYWLAPRRSTRFAEVLAAAIRVTLLLRASESLFAVYLSRNDAVRVGFRW
jgi:uncharacterized BrkB/YihY/UPF0761 family membrane protein